MEAKREPYGGAARVCRVLSDLKEKGKQEEAGFDRPKRRKEREERKEAGGEVKRGIVAIYLEREKGVAFPSFSRYFFCVWWVL